MITFILFLNTNSACDQSLIFCNFLFCFLCAMPFSYTNEMSKHMDFDNHEQNITLRCRVRNDKDIFKRFWINVLQNKNFPWGKAEGNSCCRRGHYKTEAFAWRPRLSGHSGKIQFTCTSYRVYPLPAMRNL